MPTFIVRVTEYFEPDGFLLDGKAAQRLGKPFPDLTKAKSYADHAIERFKDTRTVIEVFQRNGPAKYRVERDASGRVTRTALV